MDRKRVIITFLVVVVLAALVIWQVHSWRKFDWDIFAQSLQQLSWWKILGAVALVHIADGLRAVRWAIFLRPVKRVSSFSLLPAQYIGFAGLALLGRPGEVIRPLVIARRTGLTFASQFAVWTVERIFDISAVTVIVAADLLFSGTLRTFTDKQYDIMRALGAVLILIVCGLLSFAFSVWRNGEQLAVWLEAKLRRRYPHVAHRIAARIRIFSAGLHTIHDFGSFLAISVLSLVIWLLIASTYYTVLQSYSDETVYTMTFVYGIILMAFSVAGGVLQLPVVGGGSQLSTIKALYSLFSTPQELATSCGMMLWLVTFVSVTPLGLILARIEHLSLRKLGAESHAQEEEVEAADQPLSFEER
ncbi:MAG TPA: lysylphosphatidylglycerol synthase transmembrane domain-containing protein [Terriglobales bacterium]|nr:lysylphosphatidylglycerol synthase transmembrane domain-containing protein [Terriglobales bacterium]